MIIIDKDYAYICSPYKATMCTSVKEHIEHAQKACRVTYELGYIPIAPHLYFPQFMNDNNLVEREKCLTMGIELMKKSKVVFVFLYPGEAPSEGMKREIDTAIDLDIQVCFKEVN